MTTGATSVPHARGERALDQIGPSLDPVGELLGQVRDHVEEVEKDKRVQRHDDANRSRQPGDVFGGREAHESEHEAR
jgi:hypothetical protein